MAKVTGREARLERFMTNEEVYFICDKKRNLYHKKDCEGIDFIVNKDLCSCGPNPENKGFKPCPVCKPTPVEVPSKKKNTGHHRKKTRKDSLQSALSLLASRHNMHIDFNGPTAYVTTLAGEWFFNFTDTSNNIILHHKNNVKYDSQGKRYPGDFHTQDLSFDSSLSVMSYIARHERATENRHLIAKASQISSQLDEETGLEVLFLGECQINHGDRVKALFPSGWEDILIRFRNCERTGAKWYIATDKFACYSPIGLFAVSQRSSIPHQTEDIYEEF